MKVYNKPMAEIECFALDSEFASGGCGAVSSIINYQSIVPSQATEYYFGTNDGKIVGGIDSFLSVADYVVEKGYMNNRMEVAKLALNNPVQLSVYVDEWMVNTNPQIYGFPTDDGNSKTCYFSFIEPASSKTFS